MVLRLAAGRIADLMAGALRLPLCHRLGGAENATGEPSWLPCPHL